MENFAKRLAIDYAVSFNGSSKRTFPDRLLEKDFDIIKRAYELLSESVEKNVPISPSGEWLLDNFYIIEEQVNAIRISIDIKKYVELPSIYGLARIYLLANELVKFSDGAISRENIESFFEAYQTKKILSQSEIYEIPLMLQIALVEHIKNVSKKIIEEQLQKFKVESLVERIIENKDISMQKFKKYRGINLYNQAGVYVEYLIYLLRKMGKEGTSYLEILEEEIAKKGTSSYEIIKTEHYDMAIRRVSISNAILSMKLIQRLDFKNVFSRINYVEKILLANKSYVKLDEDTKELYRNRIKKISEKAKVSEIYVVEKLEEISKENAYDISEFLFGVLEDVFLERLGIKKKKIRLTSQIKLLLYLVAIYVPTLILSISISVKAWWILFIPVSEIFVQVVNRSISRYIRPRRLLKNEIINEDIKTFVIVPTLLNDANRTKRMFKNIERYYLNNKDANLYFCLLGDASEEKEQEVKHDKEVIDAGLQMTEELNKKYNTNIFNFIYRSRRFCETQNNYLGYERKRGMIEEFNEFLITGNQGTFKVNTIKEIPKIKYVITLDADTELIMDSAKKLIGAMEHPFNKPIVENGIVVKGYGLIQPKVEISLEASNNTCFSRLFAGNGGFDIYSTAESNVYQDVFGEAIFTGKGIYNLKVFHELLKNEIPKNLVLSHDLLEGSYVRVGLATDIKVFDGFPAKINSYFLRLHRWIRGDWQIISWLKSKKINSVSKYKILDNLRRSTLDIFLLILFFCGYFYLPLLIIFLDVFLGIKKKVFETREELRDSFLRGLINLITLPYKAVLETRAIFITLYRLIISKKNLLEWTTADDAERLLSNDLKSYIKEMIICPVIGLALILTTLLYNPLNLAEVTLLFILWYSSPFVCHLVSSQTKVKSRESINEKEEMFLKDVARRTWKFFDININENNNYLMPDNYDEFRKKKLAEYTSSTNIGLSLIAVISAYDLRFITITECIKRLNEICTTLRKLKLWNGHLYNWYDIKTLEPIKPEFISTVDSGNFVAYLFVVVGFAKSALEEDLPEEQKRVLIDIKSFAEQTISQTDFSKLFNCENNLFSIGVNVNENKLIDSYYDLLASEARMASFVAVAKKDVSYKHWFYLGRTMAGLNNRMGLASWSGTMFEYFMPDLVMPKFKNSLIDKTYEFCLYCQKEYAKKYKIPWGMSEAAYNLKDLNYNYQYKALGVPWLGLKRGIDEDIVIAPYATALTLCTNKKDAVENLKKIKSINAYDEYGFFESIDYTPSRTGKEKYQIVKTYMAHHQGLILGSINNVLNKDVLKKYFLSNEQIEATQIILQEKFPKYNKFITKDKKKVKELKYVDYEDAREIVINNPNRNANVLNNEKCMMVINDFGEGFFKFEDIYISRYREDYKISDIVYVKNQNTGNFWSTTLFPMIKKPDVYQVKFSPFESCFYRRDEGIETFTRMIISPKENIRIRQVELKNSYIDTVNVRVVMYLETILSRVDSDIVHPAYNGMFISMKEYNGKLIVERKNQKGDSFYCGIFSFNDADVSCNYVVDKTQIIGRCRDLTNPKILDNDVLDNHILNTVNPAIVINLNLSINPNESAKINFYVCCSNDLEDLKQMLDDFSQYNDVKNIREMAISRSVIENRFYEFKVKDICIYNKLLSQVLFGSQTREKYLKEIESNVLSQSDLWKYAISGDLPMITICIKSVKDAYVIKELIAAIEYFNLKKVQIDLIILNDEEDSECYVENRIKEYLYEKGLGYLLNCNGGVHLINSSKLNNDERNLIYCCSRVIFDASQGFLKEQIESGEL